jgi:hypothetical protein
MKAVPAALLAVAVGLAGPARADLVPTAQVSFGLHRERLSLALGGTDHVESRSDLRLAFGLGLAHPVRTSLHVDGHASLAFGPTFADGRYPLVLREDVTFVARWASVALRAGLGPGLTLDTSRPSMSFVEIGVPLSVTLSDTIELVYRPFLSIPLSAEERAVFGGTRRKSADLAVVPLDLTLRVRVRALGF